jgi:hypothetical protein
MGGDSECILMSVDPLIPPKLAAIHIVEWAGAWRGAPFAGIGKAHDRRFKATNSARFA